MPDETKKQRGKHEAKEQRRRRQGRQPAAPVERIPEKKQTVFIVPEPEKPEYVPPGPEFYKNLKRETDEILKITEEANSKYKKKEIQSNWAKYEIPVETYEEIEEQENIGADYEKLIQAPMSIGGHFQFKHEKSWDSETGPSLYDKYFDIDMDLLTLAVSTVPFYERNGIEKTFFNETDIIAMDHRATKFKQKYYHDKKYTTAELEVQDKILKSLTDDKESGIIKDDDNDVNQDFGVNERPLDTKDSIEDKSVLKPTVSSPNVMEEKKLAEFQNKKPLEEIILRPDTLESTICGPIKIVQDPKQEKIKEINQSEEITFKPSIDETVNKNKPQEVLDIKEKHTDKIASTEPKVVFTKPEPVVEITTKVTKDVTSPKNPVIESPADLEKWLDDFLDG